MKDIDQILQSQLNDIKEQGTFKEERVIETAQESEINVNGKKVLNFCANNYLGLANNSFCYFIYKLNRRVTRQNSTIGCF